MQTAVATLDVVPKKRKRRLIDEEYEDTLESYWHGRPEEDYEEFLEASKTWAIWAFLHDSSDRGQGRNHEIRCVEGHHSFTQLLIESAEEMAADPRSKVVMRPVCWWDIQARFHDVARTDINRLAWDLQTQLTLESVGQLEAEQIITWHSGVWTLFSKASREFILRLKQPGRIHVAPYQEKLCFSA